MKRLPGEGEQTKVISIHCVTTFKSTPYLGAWPLEIMMMILVFPEHSLGNFEGRGRVRRRRRCNMGPGKAFPLLPGYKCL